VRKPKHHAGVKGREMGEEHNLIERGTLVETTISRGDGGGEWEKDDRDFFRRCVYIRFEDVGNRVPSFSEYYCSKSGGSQHRI